MIKVIKQNGYGNKKNDGQPIMRNKIEVGRKKLYYCDSYKDKEILCGKVIKSIHMYNERNEQNLAY